jgi:hypothetical protein
VYAPILELGSFETLPHLLKIEVLRELLETLVTIDRVYLRAHPAAPPLYASGVRYVREAPGRDAWQDVARARETGFASSADLVAWRVAELRESGDDGASPVIAHMIGTGDATLWHVTLTHGNDGAAEDPAAILGLL